MDRSRNSLVYGMVGLVGLSTDVGVFTILTAVQVPLLVAQGLSLLMAAITTFLLHSGVTFKVGPSWKSFFGYLALVSVGSFFGTIFLAVLVTVGLDIFFSKAASASAVAFVQFLVSSKLLFSSDTQQSMVRRYGVRRPVRPEENAAHFLQI